MKPNEVKRGMLVVVQEGYTMGNEPGTITKVLSRPDELSDWAFKLMGRRKVKNYTPSEQSVVYCEDISGISSGTFRNVPCYAELLHDLRPATEAEKKLYHKLKKKLRK